MTSPTTPFSTLPPDGKNTPAARKAWATAQNFESVFLNTLMAPAFENLEGEGPLGGENGAGGEACAACWWMNTPRASLARAASGFRSISTVN